MDPPGFRQTSDANAEKTQDSPPVLPRRSIKSEGPKQSDPCSEGKENMRIVGIVKKHNESSMNNNNNNPNKPSPNVHAPSSFKSPKLQPSQLDRMFAQSTTPAMGAKTAKTPASSVPSSSRRFGITLMATPGDVLNRSRTASTRADFRVQPTARLPQTIRACEPFAARL